MRNLKTVLVLAAAVTVACFGFGKVVIKGNVGGRTINPQTVFAYLIDKQYEATDNGKFVLVPLPAEAQILVVQLDGAAYDPSQDLRFLAADEKLRISNEQALNGSVKIVIEAAGKLGSTFESSTDNARCGFFFGGPAPTDPGFQNFCYTFAAAEITNGEPPQKLPSIGSARKFGVKLDKIGKKAGEVTSGKVTLEFKKKTGDSPDPTEALEGTIELEVEAEHVGQRVAQCNPDPRYLDSYVRPHGSFGSSFGGLVEGDEECDQFEGG